MATSKAKSTPSTPRKSASSKKVATSSKIQASSDRKARPERPKVATLATSSTHRTRKATLVALLSRPEGAALKELVAATAWQVHSIHAALTHFRQAGHAIGRIRDESGASRYRMTAA